MDAGKHVQRASPAVIFGDHEPFHGVSHVK
jgi:hypothetical protein